MVVVTCLFYYPLEEIHQASTVNIPLNVLKTQSYIFNSHDVVSLFTKTPVQETLTIIRERVEKDQDLKKRTNLEVDDTMDLTEFIATLTYFPHTQFGNKANNSLKKGKLKYFSENLDANKSYPHITWRLFNELQSGKSTKVSHVKTENLVFTSPGDIAEALNNHFKNIGQSLAQ